MKESDRRYPPWPVRNGPQVAAILPACAPQCVGLLRAGLSSWK